MEFSGLTGLMCVSIYVLVTLIYMVLIELLFLYLAIVLWSLIVIWLWIGNIYEMWFDVHVWNVVALYDWHDVMKCEG